MKSLILSSVLSFLIVLSPALVLGAELVPCNGPECEACHLVELADNIVEFLVSFSIVVAGIIFAWGGMEMVMSAGNPGKVTSGKNKMGNAVVGIVITLAAWLMVDTVLKIVLNEDAYGMWNEIQCINT